MEPFTINEGIIDEDEYFIFDDVSSSSLEETDSDVSLTESEEGGDMLLHQYTQQQQQQMTPQLFTPSSVSSLFTTTTSDFNQRTPALVAHLKPAKGRDDNYTIGDFPASLLCNPYKYDLKLVGEINPGKTTSPATAAKSISELLNQQRVASVMKDESEFLVVTLVDADTMTAPIICTTAPASVHSMNQQSNTTTTTTGANSTTTGTNLKKGNVSVESITQVHNDERIIRFTFNLCSFHVKRRAFRLVVTNKNTGENVFVSSPFKTFARKRERANGKNNNSTTSSNGISKKHSTKEQNATVTNIATKVLPNMYFMNQLSAAADKKKGRSVRATPYPTLNKMNRYSPTIVTHDHMVPTEIPSVPQYPHQIPVYAAAPMSGYGMYPATTTGFHHHPGYTYPIENLLQNLGPQERTSLAIQLMSSLTPVERETVDFYLSCSSQCFTMNQAVKPEEVEACFITTSQPHVNSRV